MAHSEETTHEQSALEVRRRFALPTGLKRGFQVLAVRNYRLYWFGQAISLTGTWMQTTAQAWLVLQLTQEPFSLGMVTTLQFLPIMILSLFGGVVADRVSKHRLLIITQSAGLLQSAVFGMLVATGGIQLWHIYILSFIQGTINAIDNPSRQAFAVELVGREHLINAVALNSIQFNTARVIGPAIAGILIASIGIAPTIFCNAFSFLAVITGLILMRPEEFFIKTTRSEGSMAQRLREGLRYSWRTNDVLIILLIVAVIGTFGFNFTVMLPLIAGFVLHTDATGFGALSAFLGIGSMAAAIGTAYTRTIALPRLLAATGAFILILAGVALSSQFGISAMLLMGLGFAGITFATTANSLLQLIVPDELRGRVMSLYVLLFAGTTPIGGLLLGSLSNAIGVQYTLLICALLCLIGVGSALIYRHIRMASALAQVEPS